LQSGRAERDARSIEFADGRSVLQPDAAGSDIGAEIIFAANRCTRQAAQHGDLSDVRECIRNRPLKKLFGRGSQRES
jgi:hypothetical protein